MNNILMSLSIFIIRDVSIIDYVEQILNDAKSVSNIYFDRKKSELRLSFTMNYI